MKFTTHISRQQAEHGFASFRNLPIISVTDIGSAVPNLQHYSAACYVKFHDIDKDIMDNISRKQYFCMNERQGEIILNFIEVHKDTSIIVHCEAGISRSAAIAQFISDNYGHLLKGNTMLANRHVYSTLRKLWEEKYAPKLSGEAV